MIVECPVRAQSRTGDIFSLMIQLLPLNSLMFVPPSILTA